MTVNRLGRFLFLALVLVGCAPRWTVIKQAEPSPLVGKKQFVVLPIDYAGLKIGKKTEQQFLADKKKEEVESFATDKIELAKKFQEQLIAEAKSRGISVQSAEGAPKTFVLKPRIGFLETGFYAVVASGPSHVILRLAIEDQDGKLLDEIEFSHKTLPNSWANVASGARLRDDAKAIGQLAGKYLHSRVSPP